MDWLEEKAEKFHTYIRSLSFRKAMIAYILILAAAVYGLSYLTMIFCGQWEAGLWEKQRSHTLFFMRKSCCRRTGTQGPVLQMKHHFC